MTYQEAVSYLNSFVDYERQRVFPYREGLSLERIRSFLASLDNPHDELRCIHVAGTKGKGSVSAFVAYILRAAGYKVGLYTSPHLHDFRERIRVLNPEPLHGRQACLWDRQAKSEFEGMISPGSICWLVSRLKPKIEKFNIDSEYGALTLFEVWTSIAFVYFSVRKTDFVVLETGLGGRLDATNVVESLVAGLTPLSLEHTELLGNSLAEIAWEKAGIIKGQRVIVVSAPQEKEASEVIRKRCRDVDVRSYEIGRDIKIRDMRNDSGKNVFSIKGIVNDYTDLRIKLLGRHQVINAAMALGIVESLRFYGIIISKSAIRKGLSNTLWPGRFEIMKQRPLIILDGAQNKASALALSRAVRDVFKKKIILVFGVSVDKDIAGILNVLLPLSKKVMWTRADHPRALAAAEIMAKVDFLPQSCETVLTNNAGQALMLALGTAHQEDLILVTGSLFVVAEVREILKNWIL